jgi:DNA repair protein RadC
MKYENTINIKEWAEEDRPREKLMLKGRSSLSNAELIAILLGSGSRKETAVDLAKRILESATNNLSELSRRSVHDLCKINGIGNAKAVSIIAAMELGNRKRSEHAIKKEKISSSKDIFEIMGSLLSEATYEEFWIVLLNRANRLIRKMCISEGGMAGTVADPKKIFKLALENNAASMILCHNHPSGNHKPSEADIRLTGRMVKAGKLLELPVLDHVIIGQDQYYSFADEGMI